MNKTLLALCIIFTTGCVSTGTIQGVSEGRVVHFNYEQELFENDGLLEINMPDGEIYSGKFVQSSSSSSGDDWEIGESSNDDKWILSDSTNVSSQTLALLIGNKGNTMKCKFQLSDPSDGIDGGGIGQCLTSKEQKIAITF